MRHFIKIQLILSAYFLLCHTFPVCSLQAQSYIDLLSLKKPCKEDCMTQKKLLSRWKIDTEYCYQIKADNIDSMRSVSYALDTQMIKRGYYSPIQFRVYLNNGKFYTGWEFCFGKLNKLGILKQDTITLISRLPVNPNLTFEKDKNIFLGEQCQDSLAKIDPCNYKYVIVAFWAGYYGRASRKMLQRIQHFINRTDSKVMFIKVNYNGIK